MEDEQKEKASVKTPLVQEEADSLIQTRTHTEENPFWSTRCLPELFFLFFPLQSLFLLKLSPWRLASHSAWQPSLCVVVVVVVAAAAGPPCFRQQVQLTIWQLTPMEGVIQSSRGWVDPVRAFRRSGPKPTNQQTSDTGREGKTTQRWWGRDWWRTDVSTLFSPTGVGQTCCLFFFFFCYCCYGEVLIFFLLCFYSLQRVFTNAIHILLLLVDNNKPFIC